MGKGEEMGQLGMCWAWHKTRWMEQSTTLEEQELGSDRQGPKCHSRSLALKEQATGSPCRSLAGERQQSDTSSRPTGQNPSLGLTGLLAQRMLSFIGVLYIRGDPATWRRGSCKGGAGPAVAVAGPHSRRGSLSPSLTRALHRY